MPASHVRTVQPTDDSTFVASLYTTRRPPHIGAAEIAKRGSRPSWTMIPLQRMDRSLFRYIWQHSRRDQLIVCAVVLASLPFYFASLDLPRRIVNEAIQGGAFRGGKTTAP